MKKSRKSETFSFENRSKTNREYAKPEEHGKLVNLNLRQSLIIGLTTVFSVVGGFPSFF